MDSVNSEDRSAAESVIERLYIAVESLCTGPGDARARLVDAAITLVPLRVVDFPKGLQKEFEAIMDELTKYPARYKGEGRIHGTMAKIKNSTGSKIATRIWKLFGDVQELRDRPLL